MLVPIAIAGVVFGALMVLGWIVDKLMSRKWRRWMDRNLW